MTYPTPRLQAFNLLFERPGSAPKPVVTKNNHPYHIYSTTPRTLNPSPTSSTSTLVSEDGDTPKVFTTDHFGMPIRELTASPTPEPHQRNGPRLDMNRYDSKGFEELNPHAMPFVPSFSPAMRRSSTQSPPTQLRRAAPRQTSPPWTQLVWTLCSDPHAQDPAALAHHAAYIASSYPWTPSTLASLAEQLCLAGADPQCQPTHTSAAAVTQADRPVASVTGALYDALHETHGPHTAGSLLWHLAECAIEAFREFWDPSLPHSMTPQNAPTCGYAAKAACSAAFIGDLFSCDLISPQHLFGCLTILLQGFISVEHCAAFSAAVQRAGPRILVPDPQQPYEAAEYFRHFLWAAGSLKDGSSVVGVSLRKGGLDKRVGEFVEVVNVWLQARGDDLLSVSA